MPIENPSLIPEKIISFIARNGPSLPVHIAREVKLDMIFTSAFLSELISNQRIKTSYMKVGTSPIYFIPGQEPALEKFTEYIKGKEREALNLLKRKKFLIDEKQESAIKIALRGLKDFAKPFEKDGILIWRYFTEKESEYEKEEVKLETPEKKVSEETNAKKEKPKEAEAKKTAVHEDRKKTKKIVSPKKKKSTKQNDEKFFNKVKEYLLKNGIEILDIISFNKKDLVLKVVEKEKEKLIVAYNKKRIAEKEIFEAYKKAEETGMEYSVLSMGETPKKISNIVDAVKKINSIEKIE